MKPVTMVGCGILAKEVQFIVQKNNWPVTCRFSSSSLHVDFEKLRNTLEYNLQRYGDENPVVLYGTCHPLMQDILDKYNTHRTQGQNCIEMLLGKEDFLRELTNGAFFLLEDWAHTWKKILPASIGENPALWSEIFHIQHKYVLALKTPCSGNFTQQAESFAQAVNLPLRWRDVPTNHLEKVLSELLIDTPTPPEDEKDRTIRDLRKRINKLVQEKADHQIVSELMAVLAPVSGLKEVTRKIIDILAGLLAGDNVALYFHTNDSWHYTDLYGEELEIPFPDDALIAEVLKTGEASEKGGECVPTAIEYMANWDNDGSSTDNQDIPSMSFAIPLKIQSDVIGVVKFDGMIVNYTRLIPQLAVISNYLALVLNNELSNYSELEKAYKEVRRLRNYLSNIVDSMPSVLVGVDKDGNVTQWNRTAEEKTGITTDEAFGKNIRDLIPSLSSELSRITESIRTRNIQRNQKKMRVEENSLRYEDITVYPLVANGTDGAVIRTDDVTERVQMEEMIIQSEKMLSVGGLAAGMAHEINNPLAGLMQTADIVSKRLNDTSIPANQKAAQDTGISIEAIHNYMQLRGILNMLSALKESGTRIADIVNNMLSFARKGGATGNPLIDIKKLLDRTLELASTDYDLKKHYDFKLLKICKEYQCNLPLVQCESSKIQQVLLNLFKNAAQAMSEANTPNPHLILRTSHDIRRNMLCIEVEDNGPGMDKLTRKRIFEPFYTTKPTGEGTGLGLSVSYFIVTENHGGELTVESQPGLGTKFTICLPLESQ